MTKHQPIETADPVETKVAALRRERGRLSRSARDGDAKAAKRIDAINADIRRLADLSDQIADQEDLEKREFTRGKAKQRQMAIARANREMRTAIDVHRQLVARVEGAVDALVPALTELVAASDALWDRHRDLAPERVDALSPGTVRHRLASYLSAQLGRVAVLDADRKLQNAAHTPYCPALSESETEFYDRLLAPVPEVNDDD